MSVTPTAALPPTVADVKGWSLVDFSSLDAPVPDDDLQVQLDRTCAYLAAVTGRPFDDSMPQPLLPIAQDAIQLSVELNSFKSQPDYVETASDDLIQSFSAGNYSETRKEPGRSRYTGMTTGLPVISDNPQLNQDIWLLCTPQMQEYWRFVLQNQGAPTIEVTEADWGNYDGIYPYSFGVGMTRGSLLDPTVWGA